MPSLLDIPEDTGVLDALGDLYRRVTGGTPSMPAGPADFPYEANPVGTSTTRPQYASDATNQPFDPVAGHGLPVTRGQLAGIARDAWQTAGAVSDGGIGTPAGLLGAIKAYHGSPHDFPKVAEIIFRDGRPNMTVPLETAMDPALVHAIQQGYVTVKEHPLGRFDLSKIGTGEGTQAYGHGLYFAEHEGTARTYKGVQGNAAADPMANVAAKVVAAGRDAEKRLSQVFPQASAEEIRAAIERTKNPPAGKMYEVNLDVEPHQLLDWDKYMKEQPAKLQAIAAAHPELAEKLAPFGLGSYPGGRIHAELADKLAPGNFAAGQVAASNALRDAGIPGIKYLDAGSRGAGTGTSNFVMFDDKFIKILRKYGLIGTAGGGAAAAAGGNQEQSQ